MKFNETAQQYAGEVLNRVFTTTAASLSIVGATIIFCTYILWPNVRTNSRKIITFISVGDFFTALTNLLGLWDETPSELSSTVCEVEAILNIVAVLSSFFWTVYLSLYLYLTICKNISHDSERRLMSVFQLTAWGIPVILAGLAAALKVLGSSHGYTSAGWCWIKSFEHWEDMVLWMVIVGKGWEVLAYLAISLFYALVKLHIRRELKSGCEHGSSFLTAKALETVKKADTKFTLIPVVFILLRMWGTLRFLRFVTCLPECYHTGASFQGWLLLLQWYHFKLASIGDSPSRAIAEHKAKAKAGTVTGQYHVTCVGEPEELSVGFTARDTCHFRELETAVRDLPILSSFACSQKR